MMAYHGKCWRSWGTAVITSPLFFRWPSQVWQLASAGSWASTSPNPLVLSGSWVMFSCGGITQSLTEITTKLPWAVPVNRSAMPRGQHQQQVRQPLPTCSDKNFKPRRCCSCSVSCLMFWFWSLKHSKVGFGVWGGRVLLEKQQCWNSTTWESMFILLLRTPPTFKASF